jgi:hypothetical protein
MYEIKVTPDNGARYVVTVSRDDLGAIMKEVSRRLIIGEVNSFTVHTIWESVEN